MKLENSAFEMSNNPSRVSFVIKWRFHFAPLIFTWTPWASKAAAAIKLNHSNQPDSAQRCLLLRTTNIIPSYLLNIDGTVIINRGRNELQGRPRRGK